MKKLLIGLFALGSLTAQGEECVPLKSKNTQIEGPRILLRGYLCVEDKVNNSDGSVTLQNPNFTSLDPLSGQRGRMFVRSRRAAATDVCQLVLDYVYRARNVKVFIATLDNSESRSVVDRLYPSKKAKYTKLATRFLSFGGEETPWKVLESVTCERRTLPRVDIENIFLFD